MSNVKIIFLFIILGWLLFTFKLTEVPPGINGDEATIGYNAALVARTDGVFLLATLPLFVLGIIKILRKSNSPLNFILGVFFLISSSTVSQNLGKNVEIWKDEKSEFALLINR